MIIIKPLSQTLVLALQLYNNRGSKPSNYIVLQMSPFYFRKIIILFFLLANSSIIGQNISGKIVDPENNPLEFVAVVILNPADSILVSYANTDNNGVFKLIQIPDGKQVFQVHMIGFKTHQKLIEFKDQNIDMGTIILELENILDEIVITAVIPVSIRNDTISYDTRAFRIRPDDSVEDLIKKLPDMEVDADGKIFAQGEQITKIYIDGKEFFSDDPSIAIKNLSADVIKKIEVINESSNEARVSGVSDVDRPKVINIKLKDNKKINAFGKAQGGYGTDNRFLTSLNYNRFTPKFQVSVIGKWNNVNSLGSDISDLMTFNNGANKKKITKNEVLNSGFITTGVVGVNLGYEFQKSQDLNVDYFYNHTDRTSGNVLTNRTEFIRDQEIKSERMSNKHTITNNHKANFNYRDLSKKRSSFELRGKIGAIKTEGVGVNTLDKYNGNGELDLQSKGDFLTKSDRNNVSLKSQYVVKFNDSIKRSLQINADVLSNSNKSSSFNGQQNTYKISKPDQTYNLKQETLKDQKILNVTSAFNLKYNEPLNDNHHLNFQLGTTYRIKEKDVDQNKHIDDVAQDPLIYKLEYNNIDLKAGVIYKYDYNNKLVISGGATFLHQMQNFGLLNDPTQFNNSYNNFMPQFSARYKSARGRFTMLRLRKAIILPSINQISPAINDFNPLSIKQGNPYLTPQEVYSIKGTLNRYYFTSGFSFISHLNYNLTDNAIVKSETTDEEGVQTITYENYGDRKSLRFDVTFRKRIKPLGFRLNLSLDGRLSNYFTIINSELNETSSKTGSVRLSIENDKKNTIDATIGVYLNKNFTSFSSVQNVDRDFLQQTYYAKVDWNISDRFNLNSQFKYDIYTDSNFETAQKIPIWNATFVYTFKNSKLMNAKFTALDILNKNVGLVRTSSDNYFQEIQREVLGTYYMLSLTFNLNSTKSRKKV